MRFSKMHSTQVGLVLELFTGSISTQYHIVFYEMISTMVSSTGADPEFWISMVTSSNSRIQVMLDQEYDPEMNCRWLNSNEQLTCFRKYIERIVVRVKGSE